MENETKRIIEIFKNSSIAIARGINLPTDNNFKYKVILQDRNNVINTYAIRARNNERLQSPISGYEVLLKNLSDSFEEKIKIHSISYDDRDKKYILLVFTNITVTIIFGILSNCE